MSSAAAAEDEEWETADVNLGSLKLVCRRIELIFRKFVYFTDSKLKKPMTLITVG